ncbi:MAG: hypothetical protein AB1297_09390, partial [bacterium]
GNTSSKERHFIIDTSPPKTGINGVITNQKKTITIKRITIIYTDCQGNEKRRETIEEKSETTEKGKASFTWEGEDNLTPSNMLKFSYRLSPSPFGGFGYAKKIEYKGLSCGNYLFEVKAKDEAGNIEDPASKYTFEIKEETEEKISEETKYIKECEEEDKPPETWITSSKIKNQKKTITITRITTIYLDCRDRETGRSTTESKSETIEQGKASFTWTGRDDKTPVDMLSYFYSCGSKAPKNKAGPPTYADYTLSKGSYRFEVQAVDRGGNVDPTPAECSFTISEETEEKTEEYTVYIKAPGPSCRPPDDNNSLPQEIDWVPVSLYSDILVLNSGYVKEMCKLLSDLNEPFNLRDPDAPLELFTKYPLLIIPSGGLIGKSNNPIFREKLRDYVSQGGTLISFAQQQGREFSCLPGTPTGFGWTEDEFCFTNSVYIEKPHPIMSGQNGLYITGNVDGYLMSYPENSEILLTRKKNYNPVMISYSYGTGSVIISSCMCLAYDENDGKTQM